MSKLCAYLSYRDVDSAITWLEALGFETTTRQQKVGAKFENGRTTNAVRSDLARWAKHRGVKPAFA